MNELINELQLLQVTGFRDRATLRVWLETHQIRYLSGKRGAIITTLDAFNSALGLLDNKNANMQEHGCTIEIR